MTTRYDLIIDGRLAPGSGPAIPVENPATEEIIAEVACAGVRELEAAAAAAERAFTDWSATSAYDRSRILERAADLIRGRQDEVALTMSREQGKLVSEAAREVGFAADVLEWYAEEGRRGYGEIVPGRNAAQRQLVLNEPVGPIAAFSPWNFPAGAPMLKVAPALAAGCTVVVKPSEETPGTFFAIAEALIEAGLPAGVLNVVYGVPAEVSGYLIDHPAIRKISFTGSIEVGKQLAVRAAHSLKRVTLELGGHAPVIICDDVDVECVAKAATTAKYRNAGQICISPTRFFVAADAYGDFIDAFREFAGRIVPGPGDRPESGMGPLANRRRLDAMERIVADAETKGAKVAVGGERIGNGGYFFAPTVICDASDELEIMQREPFGPVAAITPFTDYGEALRRANALPYGLAGYVFTHSATLARDLSDQLQCGMVGINHFDLSTPETPFGGVKESGYGSEGGREGMRPYLTTKLVSQI